MAGVVRTQCGIVKEDPVLSDGSTHGYITPTLSRDIELFTKQKYTLKKKLGQGVSGTAFLVNNKEEELYVIKEIICRDKSSDAVKQEVDILKDLHHAYIVAYEDSFEDREAGLFYIVMEYCAEGDLYKRMQTQKRNEFTEEQVTYEIRDWFVQICLALQCLHEKNILHRDIKPQNVFLTAYGYINVGDFGCGKALERADQYAQSVVGAELYVSPEVLKQRCTSKSDIWSLGWLIHDLCMLDIWSDILERRFRHANSMRGTPPDISEEYSEELRQLIKEMLSCNPKDRPSADEILAKPFLNDAVNRNKNIPEAFTRKFMKSIMTFDQAYNKHYNELEILVSEWKQATDSLEGIHYNCTAGSLSGAVIGAAGGTTALVGAVLAPFTLGASLIVTGVGVGVGVAGGVTGAASNITNTVKQKSLRESLQKIEQTYNNASAPILNSLKTLKKCMKTIARFGVFVSASTSDMVQMSWRVGRSTAVGAGEIAHLLANIGRFGAQAAKIGRMAAAVSGVLSGLLIIADVAFIVKDSMEIHEMRTKKTTDDPETFNSSLLKSIAQMRKTHEELCNLLNEIKNAKEELNEYIETARENP
ncbi:probable serine/threonine-protein kinase PknB [Xyrauchen texanus]|uniref:probable serine/threonine-protein kinase PknB n=1 Tax=Xyrauchen texanus TaxID=154827 RepID=UPI002241C4C6|nr:probable serine/threonine-protein kinase PknB [Xyrauchen texanus]